MPGRSWPKATAKPPARVESPINSPSLCCWRACQTEKQPASAGVIPSRQPFGMTSRMQRVYGLAVRRRCKSCPQVGSSAKPP